MQTLTIFWRFGLRILCSIAANCLFIAAAGAEVTQPLDSISAAAAAAVEARAMQHGYDNVSIEVRPLDSRLRLPQCAEALSSSIPQSNHALGSVSVQIACPGDKPWTIYVRTHIIAQRAIPVLARPLARNTLVTAADLRMINQPVESTTNGLIEDPEQIVGMELTRALDAGSVIRVSNLRQPKVIKRGQQVTVVTGLNGLDVKVQGKALNDAVQGQRITVSNASSGKQIEGIAGSDGTVSVP